MDRPTSTARASSFWCAGPTPRGVGSGGSRPGARATGGGRTAVRGPLPCRRNSPAEGPMDSPLFKHMVHNALTTHNHCCCTHCCCTRRGRGRPVAAREAARRAWELPADQPAAGHSSQQAVSAHYMFMYLVRCGTVPCRTDYLKSVLLLHQQLNGPVDLLLHRLCCTASSSLCIPACRAALCVSRGGGGRGTATSARTSLDVHQQGCAAVS